MANLEKNNDGQNSICNHLIALEIVIMDICEPLFSYVRTTSETTARKGMLYAKYIVENLLSFLYFILKF